MTGRRALGAYVPPEVAIWLWRRVKDEAQTAPGRLMLAGQPEQARALGRFLDELEESARQFGEVMAEISESGNAEVPQTPTVAPSQVGILRTAEVADSLGRSERQVRNLCRDGRLRATRRGGTWLIDPASVDDYVQARRG